MLTLNQAICCPHPKTKSISTTTTHTINKSIFHHTQDKLISARTWSVSIQRTKKKSLSIPILKPSQIRSLTQNQANSDATSETKSIRSPLLIKSISMPPHKNQFMFDPHTKTKHFSTPTQKSCQFRSLRSSQVNFSPPHHKIKSILMPQHQNQHNFCPYTTNESISTPKLKPSQFPSLHRNQVKFDPPHIPSQFLSLIHI